MATELNPSLRCLEMIIYPMLAWLFCPAASFPVCLGHTPCCDSCWWLGSVGNASFMPWLTGRSFSELRDNAGKKRGPHRAVWQSSGWRWSKLLSFTTSSTTRNAISKPCNFERGDDQPSLAIWTVGSSSSLDSGLEPMRLRAELHSTPAPPLYRALGNLV